jgi:hypothetical protein
MNEHQPNEWCPVPHAPACMYLPVPVSMTDAAEVERHVRYWLETNDFDEARQIGFWLYHAYKKALPENYRYLADRVMNLEYVYGCPMNEEKLRESIVGILSVARKDFDWEPYFAKEKDGEKI